MFFKRMSPENLDIYDRRTALVRFEYFEVLEEVFLYFAYW